MSSLRDIIACAVNSFEAGLDNKQETIRNIESFIEDNYINKKSLEKLPAEAYYKLNKEYGLELTVNNGSFKEINV